MQFLVSTARGFPILEVDTAFESSTSLLYCQSDCFYLKVLYSDGTDSALLEGTISKAGAVNGSTSACSTVLTIHKTLMHLHCQAKFHAVHGITVLCSATAIDSPNISEIVSAATIISSKKPHHILSVGSELKDALGYNCDEMVGRSIKLLQGPSTNIEAFQAMSEAARSCLSHETTLVIHRKDGSAFSASLSLRPVLMHDSHGEAIVVMCVHAAPSNPAAPSQPDPATCPARTQGAAGTAAGTAALAEIAVRPPPWAPAAFPDHLALLHRAGLILCWDNMAAAAAAAAAAAEAEAEAEEGERYAVPGARVRVLANVNALRARSAAAAGGCPTALLCAWLLLSSETIAGEAAAAAEFGGAEEDGTDLGFLLCAGL